MRTTNEKYREDLTAYLLEVATGNGYLKGKLLNTPDLDEAWFVRQTCCHWNLLRLYLLYSNEDLKLFTQAN